MTYARICVLFIFIAVATVHADSIESTARKTHGQTVTASPTVYPIDVAGQLDRENCITRSYSRHTYAFRTDLMLAIENRGTEVVKNPRVKINGYGPPHDIDEMLDTIFENTTDDQEKIYRIWDHVRKQRHHDFPIFGSGKHYQELHDPVKYLLIYGGGFCDDTGCVISSLSHRAGFNQERVGRNPIVRALHGHMMSEVFDDGAYQFMDGDESAFYLDRENERPVSGDAVARDHDLAHREAHYGPQFQGWERSEGAAALFGKDDETTTHLEMGHTMNMDLRPGERLEYLWEYRAGYPAERPDIERRYWWNSRSFYRPPLTRATLDSTFDSIVACRPTFENRDAVLHTDPGKTAEIAFHVALPYVVSDATLAVDVECVGKARWSVAVSPDGYDPVTVERREILGRDLIECSLSPGLKLKDDVPVYVYHVSIRITPSGEGHATLKNLCVTTDFLANPLLFPYLRRGRNEIAYEDESTGPREVRIEHEWQENTDYQPPAAPSQPLSPTAGAESRDSILPFRWASVPNAGAYHLLVTTRRDTDLPYRTAYDVIVDTNEYVVPFTGMFSPDRSYYWRVRAQDSNGVWSEWSPTWSFTWSGPRVPVGLGTVSRDGEMILEWEANPRGERPHHYKVYGSNIKGFSVHDATHTVMSLGEVGPNLVCETAERSCTVVSPDPALPNMNKAFYRVVAVDGHGTESGCSDYVELPHPLIVSEPATRSIVNERFEYPVVSLRSMGDLQYRYDPPSHGFWEEETLSFELADSPEWMTIDADGLVHGTPSKAGAYSASVAVENEEGRGHVQRFTVHVEAGER